MSEGRHSPKVERGVWSKKDQARDSRIIRVLIVIILVVAAFAVGFYLRSQTALMQSLGFNLENEAMAPSALSTVRSTFDSISARVEDVEDILAADSLDEYNLDEATTSMLENMMAATGDPYAAYFTPERYSAYVSDSTNQDYAGVGVLFAEYNGRAYAADVDPESEAAAEGVQQGDYLVAIDGDSSHEWSLNEVVSELSREDGQEVAITWMRVPSLDAREGEDFTTTLACKTYQGVNVTDELVENVGVIKVRQLTQNVTELVTQSVEDLTGQGAQAFVLDVRDNAGGFLNQATDTASLFVRSGVLVQIQTKDSTTTRNATGATITDAPLVVLANGYTAAGAEVLVAALKDNQRATFVGEKTLGKGSVQVVRELDFGGAVRYTAAYYLTPNGRSINGNGIVPDIEVGPINGADTDPQLLVSIDTAQSLIQGTAVQ